MASSFTDIANQALAKIGGGTITDITSTTDVVAKQCNAVIVETIRSVGRMAQWSCLKHEQQLAVSTTTPAFSYDYQYPLPNDFLRLVSLNDTDAWDDTGWYEVRGKNLLTDETEAKIVYIRYHTDVNAYDPLFVDAVATLLASKIAIPIRQDEQLSLAMLDAFERKAFPMAAVVDANQGRRRARKPTRDSEWVGSRWGFSQSRGA